jgi:hypothetical protein
VEEVLVELWFRETDKTYMVDKASRDEIIYRIRLLDNRFTPFTANWEQGSLGANCLYSRPPEKTNCAFSAGWTCMARYNTDYTEALGCYPQKAAGQ